METKTPEEPTGPDRLGIPISDDSSEDEQSQIRALEEDQGIYYHEEVVVSPKYESDDDIPLQRFQLSHPSVQQQLHTSTEETDISKEEETTNPPSDRELFSNSGAGMERRRSVRFSGPYDTEEDGANPHFRSPSPESLRYIKALENPMAASGDLEDEFTDLINDPQEHHPLGSPPAYTSGDEGSKTPPPPSAGSNKRQGSLNEFILSKVSQPFHNMIRRASRLEEESSPNEDEEEEIDEDFSENEIAVLTYIDAFKPFVMDLHPELHPFAIEYVAAMGEVDAFIKVPRPDEIDDNVGLTSIDEPPSEQSDATIVDMQIRNATKDASLLEESAPVKILEKAHEKPDEIVKWISNIKAFRKDQAAPSVRYKNHLPDIETLMQEWGPKLEEVMKTVQIPTAELDVPLDKYVDICLNILDIPVGKSRIDSVHLMFALLNEFNSSQHFHNWAQGNNRGDEDRERTDRLEL